MFKADLATLCCQGWSDGPIWKRTVDKLLVHVAQTISLADAPAMLASLEQGMRLKGKVVIAF